MSDWHFYKVHLDSDLAARKIVTTLEDGLFRFRLYWVGRMASWFLDVRDADDNALVTGLRVIVNHDLLAPYKSDPSFPQGILMALNTRSTYAEPDRDTLGGEVIVWYMHEVVA